GGTGKAWIVLHAEAETVMITVSVPTFGRRTGQAPNQTTVNEESGESLRDLIDGGSPITEDIVNEMRNICLARLDPNVVAAMPPERLILDVERLISEVATDRRYQLNAREQHAMANELVHDITGLGPLEQLLE